MKPFLHLRIVATVLWLSACVLLRLLSLPLRLVSHRLDTRCRKRIFQLFGKGILRIARMKIDIEGQPPDPPYLLVSNHMSAFDIFVLTALLGPLFISQANVANWPIVGIGARSVGTIFINRQRLKDIVRVNAHIRDLLNDGEGIVFFPEATTSADGEVMPFKSPLFEPPAQMDLPVHYLSLSYQTPENGPSASDVLVWREPVTIYQHYVNVLSLPSSRAIVTFGANPISGTDRKVLAQKLQEAVKAGRRPLN